MISTDGWPDAQELCRIAISCLEAMLAIQSVPSGPDNNAERVTAVSQLVAAFPGPLHKLMHSGNTQGAAPHFVAHAFVGRQAVSIHWIDTNSATESVLRFALCILNHFNILNPWDWPEKQASLPFFWPYVVPTMLSPRRGHVEHSALSPKKDDDDRSPLILDFPLSAQHLKQLLDGVRYELEGLTPIPAEHAIPEVTSINTSPKAATQQPDEHKSKPKRSTVGNEAVTKLIAALTEHHQYANGRCGIQDPISNNGLARKAHVSKSSASVFFHKYFKGPKKYQRTCFDQDKLNHALALLNNEVKPHRLLDGGKHIPFEASGENDDDQ